MSGGLSLTPKPIVLTFSNKTIIMILSVFEEAEQLFFFDKQIQQSIFWESDTKIEIQRSIEQKLNAKHKKASSTACKALSCKAFWKYLYWSHTPKEVLKRKVSGLLSIYACCDSEDFAAGKGDYTAGQEPFSNTERSFFDCGSTSGSHFQYTLLHRLPVLRPWKYQSLWLPSFTRWFR